MVDDGPGKKVQPFRSFEPRGGERHVRRNRGVLACVDPLVARGAPARTLPGCVPVSVPAGDRVVVITCAGRTLMMEEVDDATLVAERIAALDLGKATR